MVIEESRNLGYLAKLTYIITSNPVRPGPELEEIWRVLPQHIDYWEALAAEGKVFGGGPIWRTESPRDRWWGVGSIVVEANSEDEAKQMAEKDPMHLEGVRSFTVAPWLVNHVAAAHRKILA